MARLAAWEEAEYRAYQSREAPPVVQRMRALLEQRHKEKQNDTPPDP
jgi:hypothetical protein